MKIFDRILDAIFGKAPTIREILGPPAPGLFTHKDHMELCPECKRHYLCRAVVCHIICARCQKKYEEASP
jgi:hypothetical protein